MHSSRHQRRASSPNLWAAAENCPLIVASVVDAAGLRRVLQAKRPAWDAVELRLDRIGTGMRIRRAAAELQDRGMPVIATIRLAVEGGAWPGDSHERLGIYERFLDVVSAVDVELRSDIFERAAKAARRENVVVIGSFHDFTGTPSGAYLSCLAKRGWARGADVVKIATSVNGAKDMATLRRLLRRSEGRLLCVIGMSEKRQDARVVLARAGSCLTYGSVGRAAAPGQISCAMLRRALGGRVAAADMGVSV